MRALSRSLPGLLPSALTGTAFLAMSWAVAGGNWPVVAALLVLPLGAWLLLGHLRAVMIAWVAGIATLFIYANNVLNAIPGLMLERVLFLGFLGMFVLRLVLRKDRPWRPIPLETAMFALMGLFLVSMLFNLSNSHAADPVEDPLLWFRGLLVPLMTFVMVRDLDWPDIWVDRFFTAAMAAGLYLAGCAYLEFFTGAEFFKPTYLETMLHPERVTGTFSNSVEFGAFLAIILIMSLFRLRQADTPGRRFRRALVVLVIAGAVILAQGRAVWLALGLVLPLLFLLDPGIRKPALVALGPALAAVAVLLLLNSGGGLGGQVGDRLNQRLEETAPIYNRLTVYASGWEMVKERPLTGWGFGRYTFTENKRGHVRAVGTISPQYASGVGLPHNELLHATVLAGLPALAVYLWMLWRMVALVLPWRPPATADSFATAFKPYMAVVVVLMLVNAQFADLMFFNAFMVLFWFLFGVFAARAVGPGGTGMVTGAAGAPARERPA